jgi:hypothetical protein
MLLAAPPVPGAGCLDFFKRKPAADQTSAASTPLSALSQDEMVGGLKEALGTGVQQVVGPHFSRTATAHMV